MSKVKDKPKKAKRSKAEKVNGVFTPHPEPVAVAERHAAQAAAVAEQWAHVKRTQDRYRLVDPAGIAADLVVEEPLELVAAVPLEAPTDPVLQNGNGQALIHYLDPVTGLEKVKGYTRVTTYIDGLDDKTVLTKWKMRTLLEGAAVESLSDLPEDERAVSKVVRSVARTDAALHDIDSREREEGELLELRRQELLKEHRTLLEGIADELMELGGAHEKANKGTNLHRLTELVDTGHALPADTTASDRRDVEAYRAKMAELDLRVLWCERRVVLDDIQVSGTMDRAYQVLLPGMQRRIRVVGDLKGLALDTTIPTPTGWTTMGEVKVGDEVLGADGVPTLVTAKSARKRIGTYVVKFDDGSEVTCDSEHIWSTQTRMRGNFRPRTMNELIHTLRDKRGDALHSVQVAKPLDLPEADLPIDPYLLGAWLGDGTRSRGVITKDAELFRILTEDGHDLGILQKGRAGEEHIHTRTVLGLQTKLREEGLLGGKWIPMAYLRASQDQRLRLLQGLMDTDGTWNINRDTAVFYSTDQALAESVAELLRTLGQRPHVATVPTRGFGLDVISYHVSFTPVNLVPFRHARKLAKVRVKPNTRSRRRVIIAIEPGPDVETACIGVAAADHLYLCGRDMIPTHNTGSVAYSHGKVATQLALYARGFGYDWEKPLERERLSLSKAYGLLVHLPQGEGRCEVYVVDLELAAKGLALAAEVREWRRVQRRAYDLKSPMVKP